MKKLLFIASVLCLGICTACVSVISAYRDVRTAENLSREGKYADAAAVYRQVLRDNPGTSAAADARFGLASLLAYYDNPQRDYGQALQEFEEFLKSYPNDKRAPEAQNWRGVLKAVVDTRKENERLNKNIEELKKLDIRHEEKRKRR